MANWYRNGQRALTAGTSWVSDNIVATLHSSTYTPSAEHAFVSSLTGELSTGGGYTSGGKSLTSLTSTYTTANSWGTTRANSTAYAVGDVIRPVSGNGGLYRCIVAGTSAGSAPTYNTTAGFTVVDGTATFEYVGGGIVVLSAASLSWSAATFTGVRYLVLSSRTPSTAASQPLLGWVDFGTDKSGLGGPFEVTWSAQGVLQVFTP